MRVDHISQYWEGGKEGERERERGGREGERGEGGWEKRGREGGRKRE